NNLGSISSIVKPLSGQENFDEKTFKELCQYLMNVISFNETSIDDIADHLKVEPSLLLAALTTLELEGMIERLPGNFAIKIAR
ncbi:MAG: hypothetical protein AAF403_07105, partial [Pseudomonadota bacterium]